MTIKTFIADTFIYQGGAEFHNEWNFSGGIDNASAINHLTELLEEKEDALEAAMEDEEEINLHGMTAKEFATLLVEDEEAAREMYGTTWEIKTFQEVCGSC